MKIDLSSLTEGELIEDLADVKTARNLIRALYSAGSRSLEIKLIINELIELENEYATALVNVKPYDCHCGDEDCNASGFCLHEGDSFGDEHYGGQIGY